jgi:hypothetical protein
VSWQVPALRYVFTVVNALQGVHIFLSFVCNQRVLSLVRAAWRHCKGVHSRLHSYSASGSSDKWGASAGTSSTIGSSRPSASNGTRISTITSM